MLGALLRVARQVLLHAGVLVVVAAAGSRPGDRARPDSIPLDPNQHLGRSPGQGEIAEIEKVHVGRRVDPPEGPVDRERRGGAAPLEPLRQDHLEDVAGPDVVLGPPHPRLVPRLAHVDRPAARPAPRRARPRETAQERPLRRLDPGPGLPIPLEQAARRERTGLVSGPDVRDDLNPLAQMIEGENGIVDPEQDVGGPEIVRTRPRQFLDLAHHVIGQVAHGPSGEAGQIGKRHGAVRGDGPPQRLERPGAVRRRPHDRDRVASEKRVARHGLAAFNRFQEERIAAARGDPEEGRDRREQIGADLAAERDDGSLPRERRKIGRIEIVAVAPQCCVSSFFGLPFFFSRMPIVFGTSKTTCTGSSSSFGLKRRRNGTSFRPVSGTGK